MNDKLFALPAPSATNAEHFEAFGYAVQHADYLTLSPAESGEYTPYPVLVVIGDGFQDDGLVYTLAKGAPSYA
jgi:hypothetical protein